MSREYRLPLLVSLLLHGGLIALLGLSLEHTPEPVVSAAPPPDVVQAVAVDAAQVEAEVERLRENERRQTAAEEARKQRIRDQAAAAKRKRQAEERRLADLKKQRAAEEKQRLAAENQRKAESERLAQLKREQQALEQRQRELERKRLAEQEQQRKLEAEKKRRAEEERKRAEAEQALKRQMAAEEQRLAAERSRANLRLMAQYTAEIQGKVQRNWLRPPGIPAGLRCSVRVRQLPGGDVVGVSIIESSGNVAFDRSVESAVRKASPLPAPPDPALFEREIDFNFTGE